MHFSVNDNLNPLYTCTCTTIHVNRLIILFYCIHDLQVSNQSLFYQKNNMLIGKNMTFKAYVDLKLEMYNHLREFLLLLYNQQLCIRPRYLVKVTCYQIWLLPHLHFPRIKFLLYFNWYSVYAFIILKPFFTSVIKLI